MSERTSKRRLCCRSPQTQGLLPGRDRSPHRLETLEKVLHQKLKRVANAVGNPPCPPLPIFKILLLQRWYNRSDMAVQEPVYGPDHAVNIGFHEKLQDGFRQGAAKITAVGLLHQLD